MLGQTGVDTNLFLAFTDGGTDLSVNAGATSPGSACAGLGDVDVEVSGLTISFDGELTAACADLIAEYDPDGTGTTAARPVDDDDTLAFEITLAEAPMTEPVASGDYKDQDIEVTGTVKVTGGGDDDVTVSYDISGEVTYMPPTITTQKAD